MSVNNLKPAVQSTKTSSKTGQRLYLSEHLADIHFIFKSGDGKIERVPAHKTLLRDASTVFRAMFSNCWKEESEVEIVDASASAFKEFLQFVYLANIKVTMENVGEVMNLGNKYDIDECLKVCVAFLKDHLNHIIVCWVYEFADLLGNKELKARLKEICEKYIKFNTSEVLASESFLECDAITVQRILQMEPIECSEATLFKALMDWIKAKIGHDLLTTEIVHDNFGDLFREIRFGSMGMLGFTALYKSHYFIFTLAEQIEIIEMFVGIKHELQFFKSFIRKK